jgi:hypothetical protein
MLIIASPLADGDSAEGAIKLNRGLVSLHDFEKELLGAA